MKKRKKKNNNNNSWLFILSRLFRRALFFLSFFPSDVSTLAFLHFFNRNAKRVFVSLFPSIQECNPSNPPSSSRCALNSLSLLNSLLKLSFFTSFVENVLFYLSSLPSSLSKASFFLWKVALRDDDYIFGYLFGSITRETFCVVVHFNLSFLSLLQHAHSCVKRVRMNINKQRFSFKRSCAGSSRKTFAQKRTVLNTPNAVNKVSFKVENKSVLIVNTNGGGHANIGFWLSKTLASAKHDVTLCVVGEETDKKMQKAPFTYFEKDLKPMGVKTMWSNPADLKSNLSGAKFDIVCDNNGKDLDSVGPVAEFAKEAGAEQFFFVSSAGIYKPTPTPPHVEGDAVKETAGHAIVEKHLVDMKFPKGMASFRPQYLTGYGSNKDCEEYFFDRIQRGKPIVIPGSGDQFASVSHAEDLATMIASAVDNANAKDEIFNCVTQKGVTLRGMAEVCAKAMGKEATIVTYKEGSVEGVEAKKQFPFRVVHFYASSAKAMAKLGWEPKHPNLEATLKDRYAEYCASGRDKKEMTFELDEKVLATL
jgi:nucleoside-diphosphate-sugar epimerase